MNFRENLRFIIESKGIQTKELASYSGLSENTIKSYLKTDSSEPRATNAVLLAKGLGVTVEYLVNGTDNQHKKHLSPEVLALESDLASLSSSDIKAISSVVKQLKEKY